MTGKDGQNITVNMGELADAFRNQPDADLLKEVELHKKVKEGDPAAIQEYVQQFVPKPEPTKDETELDKIRQEMVEMREVLAKHAPVVGQVTAQRDLEVITQMIAVKKDVAPLLQKHPNAASLVQARWEHYKAMAQKGGHDMHTLPPAIQQRSMEASIGEVEQFIKETLGVYGVATNAAGPNIVSVNDQTPQAAPGVRPANWTTKEGLLYDPSKMPAPQQPPAPLPNQPMPPMPTGAAVGIEGASQPSGPLTTETLRAKLKQRTQKVI